MTLELRAAGFFGKVPTAGDFQRHLTPDGPDGKTLDWFNDGWTRHALAGRRPDLTTPVHFCWQRPGTTTALVGVMVASRDRAGRRFPLLVFAAVGGVTRTGELIASAHDFFERAVAVAESGRAGMEPTALRGHVDTLRTAFDPTGASRQAQWQDATTFAEWANGAADAAAERLRCLRFAFSSGGRPNFVVRGRWHGDLRHLAAGTALLQHIAQEPPAMLFWTRNDEGVQWRAAWEYAASTLFEPLMWHDVQAATAFDTDPGAVVVPADFRAGPAPAADASLARVLETR